MLHIELGTFTSKLGTLLDSSLNGYIADRIGHICYKDLDTLKFISTEDILQTELGTFATKLAQSRFIDTEDKLQTEVGTFATQFGTFLKSQLQMI